MVLEYTEQATTELMKVYGTITPGTGDTEAPTSPGSFVATPVSATQVDLTWLASTDNVAVTGYQIFQDGSPITTTTELSYSVLGLSPSTQYSFTLVAFDAAGNNSATAGPSVVTTQGNAAPVWSLGNQSEETGTSVSINFDSFCSDIDGDTLTYALVSGTLPSGLTLSGTRNELLSGTVDTEETQALTFSASDGIATPTEVSITFEVTTPDVTAPAAPTGLAVAGVTSGSVTLNWDDNAEPDLASYSVYRSTDGVSFGLRQAGVLTSDYLDTGLSGSTQYWYYVTAVDTSTNESTASATVTDTTSAPSAEPYDLSGFGIHFTYSWPQIPNTSATINVPADMSLQAAVAIPNRVINVAAGTHALSGTTFFADDLDLILDDAATVDTSGDIVLGTRNRWTGGVLDSTATIGLLMNANTDVLLDNIRMEYNNPGDTTELVSIRNPGNARFAIINCTMNVRSANNQWPIHALGTSTSTDVILANVRLSHSGGAGAAFRLNPVTNFIVVDSAFNTDPAIYTSGTGMRTSGATNVYWGNVIQAGITHINYTTDTITYSVEDMRIENMAIYHPLSNIAFTAGTNALGTNTAEDCVIYSPSGTGSINLGPFTNLGGCFVAGQYTGDVSTVNYDMPGKPSLASYGADH